MNDEARWLNDDRFLDLAGSASITLTFALDLFGRKDRYRSIDVERLKDAIEIQKPEIYAASIKPCASFFDDILNARSEATSQQITFLLNSAASPAIERRAAGQLRLHRRGRALPHRPPPSCGRPAQAGTARGRDAVLERADVPECHLRLPADRAPRRGGQRI